MRRFCTWITFFGGAKKEISGVVKAYENAIGSDGNGDDFSLVAQTSTPLSYPTPD